MVASCEVVRARAAGGDILDFDAALRTRRR
jgi:hypothetical protein